MRSELVHLAECGDEHKREPFDPQTKQTSGGKELLLHGARHIRLKCQLLQSLLENAPEEWSYKVVHSWLHDADQDDARSLLFAQDAYPLNTNFEHHTLWVVLLNIMAKQLPEPGRQTNDFAEAFRSAPSDSTSCEEILSPQDMHYKIKGILGRTIVMHSAYGRNHYLKIQASDETDDEFRSSSARVAWLGDQSVQHCPMESERVRITRMVRIAAPEALLKHKLTEKDISKVLKLVGSGERLAVEFSLPEAVSYEGYVYALPERESKIRAIDRYLHDYGALWQVGISGPGCINAHHDVGEKRPHLTFPSLQAPVRVFEGSLERWNGDATDFPNMGDIGMRDLWDARMWDEKSFICLSSKTFSNEEQGLMQRKLRLLDLANAAKGAVLVYGRCFNKDFDYRDQVCLKQVESDIAERMAGLFCRAFPVSADQCHKVMHENALLEIVAREVCYWMAHHESEGFYVQDLREGKINRTVYSHLPQNMQGCILSKENDNFLTEYGFHDPERDRPGECQLGAGSGRTPLMALNAMLAKLIATGITASIQRQEEQVCRDKAEIQRAGVIAA